MVVSGVHCINNIYIHKYTHWKNYLTNVTYACMHGLHEWINRLFTNLTNVNNVE